MLEKIAEWVDKGIGLPNVVIGRLDFERVSRNKNYTVVDNLSTKFLSNSEFFDAEQEKMAYQTLTSAVITIDCYGDDAFNNAQSVVLIQQSENSTNILQKLGITVKRVSGVENLKFVDRSETTNRYQVTLEMLYTNERVLDTKRIDFAVLDEIRFNN